MASKSTKGEILAKFFDDGEYTALFADGAVSAASGYAAGQQAYAVFQNGEAVTVKDVEKNIKVLELAAQTGCPVVTFYDSVGAKLAEGLDVLTASAKLNATIAKVSGVVPQVAVVLGVCGGTSALSAANADVCVMAEDAELFFTAPFTAAAKGDKVANAGSAAAAAKAGVAAIVVPTAEEAAEKAAHIVGLLPANNLTGPAIFEFEQPTAALTVGAAPEKAAAALIDKDSAVEMYAGFGKSVYTAFATIGGNAVGVVATGEQLCHNCVAKASRFVRLCDAFSVPVPAGPAQRGGRCHHGGPAAGGPLPGPALPHPARGTERGGGPARRADPLRQRRGGPHLPAGAGRKTPPGAGDGPHLCGVRHGTRNRGLHGGALYAERSQ